MRDPFSPTQVIEIEAGDARRYPVASAIGTQVQPVALVESPFRALALVGTTLAHPADYVVTVPLTDLWEVHAVQLEANAALTGWVVQHVPNDDIQSTALVNMVSQAESHAANHPYVAYAPADKPWMVAGRSKKGVQGTVNFTPVGVAAGNSVSFGVLMRRRTLPGAPF